MASSKSLIVSWALLEEMRKPGTSSKARVRLFAKLLRLKGGFWGPKYTLKGYVVRAAQDTLDQVGSGQSLSDIDVDKLAEGILIAFCESIQDISIHPCLWLVRTAARLVERKGMSASRRLDPVVTALAQTPFTVKPAIIIATYLKSTLTRERSGRTWGRRRSPKKKKSAKKR